MANRALNQGYVKIRFVCTGLFVLFALVSHAAPVSADVRGQAYQMYSRLAGVPPTAEELDQMSAYLENGATREAAMVAVSSPSFYNVTVRSWVKGWSNNSQSNRFELNDMDALFVGAIRDDVPFNQLFSTDIMYLADPEYLSGNGFNDIPSPALNNNEHFSEIEQRRVNLHNALVRTSQRDVYQYEDQHEVAGVFTTRGFAASFYQDGTNRAPVRFSFMNWLCRDMEQMHDTTIPAHMIRQDVTRVPGGESRTFLANCQGCHAGMDPLAGAFSYVDFLGNRITFNTDVPADSKVRRNADSFPGGFVQTDNSWVNLWNDGQNASLGWRGPQSGEGMASFGSLISNTNAMAQCMADQVFELVCMRKAGSQEDRQATRNIANRFTNHTNQSVQSLFVDTAAYCL